MTDQTAQEPTMEEILASIRRIISEDDAPAETAPATAAPQAEPEPVEAEVVSPALMDETPSVQEPEATDDDVLELTDTYEAPAAESIGDLEVSPAADVDPFPVEAVSAASAFAGLASSLKKPEPMETSIPSGPTLDELARSLLRPMLKEWLDANLPGIVEAQVRKEVERIARSAG